jgi:hypothetical protein
MILRLWLSMAEASRPLAAVIALRPLGSVAMIAARPTPASRAIAPRTRSRRRPSSATS